ncbi:MAG: metallophosphatase family protein [Lachnospiraceae bacterium]|nr:metallophosphatase family protein [Lachnospiraceae bacterium]
MRIAVISDTHDVLRSEVLEQIRIADAVIHAGDVSKPEIVDRIKANLKKDALLYLVRGNADGDWAKGIPETLEFQLEQLRFFVVHNRKKAVIPDNCDIIISGHTHKFQAETENFHVEEKANADTSSDFQGRLGNINDSSGFQRGQEYGLANERFWLNPGSCGRKRFRLELSMAVLNLEERTWQVEKVAIGTEEDIVVHLTQTEQSATLLCADSTTGTRQEGDDEEFSDLSALSSGELLHLINGILTRMRRGKTISQIAAQLHLETSFVEEICRIYVTHPGVTANGILDKLEVNRHIGA